MRKMWKKEFCDLAERALNSAGFHTKKTSKGMKNAQTILRDELFHTMKRSSYGHTPDLCLDDSEYGWRGVEVKSTAELYQYGHFSKVHLVCFLLQTINGQCSSYADLIRPKDKQDLVVYLVLPKEIDENGLGDIEALFGKTLASDLSPVGKVMGLTPHYRRHELCEGSEVNYGVLQSEEGELLVTRVKFDVEPVVDEA